MVLYLDWPGFYAASSADAKGERSWALAHGGRIRDANPAALSAGITRGMGVAEAKAIVAGLRPRAWDESEWTPARDAWLGVAAAASDTVAPGFPHEAWLDLGAHPQPARVAQEVVLALSHAGTGPWRAGLALAPWVAQVAAELRDPPALWTDFVGPLVVDDAPAFLAGLDVAQLVPVDSRHRDRLRLLGYDRIGGVQSAPMEALRMQFGRDAGRIRAAALGQTDRALRGTWPPDACARTRHFPGGLEDREALRGALIQLAQHLAQGLAASDATAQRVALSLHLDDDPPREVATRLPTPTGRAVALGLKINQMVDALLAAQEREGGASPSVHAVRVTLSELKRSPGSAGRLEGMGTDAERTEQMDAAVASLVPRYGPTVIQPLGEVVRPRRERVLSDWRQIYAWS